MTRRLSAILISSLLIVILAVPSFSMKTADKTESRNRVSINGAPSYPNAGVESSVAAGKSRATQSLGFDQASSLSPGKKVGSTTYDYQHNGRMGRQVDWRGNQTIHFTWMKQISRVLGQERRTSYEAWDAVNGVFAQAGQSDSGGCDIHALTNNISGYVGLDVTPGSKAVIYNHHSETGDPAGYAPTAWYDFGSASCFFSAYRSRVPDSTQDYFADPLNETRYSWPILEYQVNGTDTVTHMVAEQSKAGINPQYTVYFRRVGSAASGTWDYPPVMIDTVNDISEVVTASRVSRKVAIVWLAPYPATSGGSESLTRGGNQRVNDVYYRMSTNMGAPGSWVPSTGGTNVSKFDSSKSGWLAHCDVSALIGSDDNLHIIWNAREYSPAGGGTWVNFYGSRLFHWDQQTNAVRVIKDANWALPDETCTGGAWNEMSMVKMQISECDGKLYALFVQFNDIFHGVTDDCHYTAFTATNQSGTANGELYIAVSDNGGYNWDIARNLTNSYTPRCDTLPTTGTPTRIECDADQWPSMSRFGMDATGGDFTGVPIVDPSGSYGGSKYLDVFYVNDKYPGGCVQDAGVWTMNPVKWFRVPCINPVPNPVLSVSPSLIGDPTWTKPNVQKDTIIRLENIGNAQMTGVTATAVKLTGTGFNWLSLGTVPSSISQLDPNYADMHVFLGGPGVTGPTAFDGLIVIDGNFVGHPDTFRVHLIVADTVQFPDTASIRTASKRIALNNAGNLGNGGKLGYGLDFFADCDTANNAAGQDNNSRTYLYDASPFVLRVNGANDTLFNNYIWNTTWLVGDGFRPLAGLTIDSNTHPEYRYAYTGKFLTKDSSIMLESELWAPKTADSGDFIIQKVKYYNNTGSAINNVFLGEVMDWDVPSDSGVENGSGFDGARKMMYVFGAEYGNDTSRYAQWNNCIASNVRMGSFAYYNGYRATGATKAAIGSPKGMFTGTNANWQRATGNFVPQQLYNKLTSLSGYEVWAATNPAMEDSLYQDLNMVSCYGQFNMPVGDTLVFVKIFSTVSNSGLTGIQAAVDKAKAWIKNRGTAIWPITTCCVVPGDANNNGTFNLLDVTFLINKLFKGGPNPPCMSQADANGNNVVNLLDVTYMINKLFKGGPACKCGAID